VGIQGEDAFGLKIIFKKSSGFNRELMAIGDKSCVQITY
jgi:hypothetical protein